MGREIRMVIPNWEHPKERTHRGEEFQPLYDRSFAAACLEWKAGYAKWEAGERPDYCTKPTLEFWEYEGSPPDRERYRPEWAESEMTWFQFYETVSEGTPLSPPFPTKEGLANWLAANGDYWSQRRGDPLHSFDYWMKFIGAGWAPSFVVTAGQGIQDGVDAVVDAPAN